MSHYHGDVKHFHGSDGTKEHEHSATELWLIARSGQVDALAADIWNTLQDHPNRFGLCARMGPRLCEAIDKLMLATGVVPPQPECTCEKADTPADCRCARCHCAVNA